MSDITESLASLSISESASSSKKPEQRSQRSPIWKYGAEVQEGGKVYWKCNLCEPLNAKLYSTSSTKHQLSYLQFAHGISKTKSTSGEEAIKHTSGQLLLNSDMFKQVILHCMILCGLSFHQVTQPTFRFLLEYLCAVATANDLPQLLPHSGNTIRSWAIDSFQSMRGVIKEELSKISSHSHVHFHLTCGAHQIICQHLT